MIKEIYYDGTCNGAFFIVINLHLTNGKDITFIGEGANGMTGPTKYFDHEAVVTVSPKQLGEAKDVNELVSLLANGVYDKDVIEGNERKIFESSNLREFEDFDWESGDIQIETVDAFEFVQEIQSTVNSMEEIESITILGIENEMGEYSREYTYNLKTKKYTLIVEGEEPFEREESGGKLDFADECMVE